MAKYILPGGKKGRLVYWIFHIPSVSILKSSQQNFQLGPMYPLPASSLKPAHEEKQHEYFIYFVTPNAHGYAVMDSVASI